MTGRVPPYDFGQLHRCGVCTCRAGGRLDILERNMFIKQIETGSWVFGFIPFFFFRIFFTSIAQTTPTPVGRTNPPHLGVPDVLHSTLHGGVCLAALCLRQRGRATWVENGGRERWEIDTNDQSICINKHK